MKALNEKVSKFLSYVLRHKPEAIGLTLNQEGWSNINELITCAANHNQELTIELINQVVSNCDKNRFAISGDGLQIRAVQGHSSSLVNINFREKKPPEFLYHGTASRFVSSIRQKGLIAGERHYVHLSEDRKTAAEVGKRYGEPTIFKIKTLSMYEQGYKFYLADNGVWLTDAVPVSFLL